ncbi:hypothetical protein [Polluticoccus soli]|uniref:hypothetical protein n=1 Tax=Polluticoccus soli TaxID=3034150 RepID=UPI0023E278C3|nr:hypothetical protein [Flavipsychrobacter sp. JY13-12]
MSSVLSTWAQSPILLSETLNDAVWENAGKMAIPGGFLLLKNDAHFLYAALDLVQDTSNDAGTGDYFWFTFDRDRNGNINPNVDVNYGLYPGQPDKMGRQYYLGPGTWTGLLNEVTQSKCKVAFESSPDSAAPHRIWKLRFEISHLNVSLAPSLFPPFTRFGVKVHSSAAPGFDYSTPANFFTSFAGLHTLYFSRKPVTPTVDAGPVIGSVGLIPTTKINSATGKATTAAGYYVHVENAAFGGGLNLIGNRTTLQNVWAAGARKYKIKHREGISGSFDDMRSSWYNYRWNGVDYVLESYGPDANNFYQLQPPSVDFSIDDLLLQFGSNTLNKGMHQFQVEFFNTANALVPTSAQTLTLFIDNTIPVVKLNSIKHAGANVSACAIVQLTSDTDGLAFNIDAHDPEGNLHSYALTAAWGSGASEVIKAETYNTAMGPNWVGVQNLNVPPSGNWVPDHSCAYSFTVSAYARTTNGYGYIGYNSVSKYITLLKPAGTSVPGMRIVMPKGIEV